MFFLLFFSFPYLQCINIDIPLGNFLSSRYYDEDLYSQAQIRWMKACHRIVVQNDVEKYRKMLDEMYGNQSNQSDASKRFSMKNARASFPVDAKYLPRSLEDDEHLPPVDGERNIYNELVNSEGKKIVKVVSLICIDDCEELNCGR